jgi:LAS superfamily LD-carboxypeptidase LdcB
VALAGHSLYRDGTELDLGPPSAYGWLERNAGRFHFVQRYAWLLWRSCFAWEAVPTV